MLKRFVLKNKFGLNDEVYHKASGEKGVITIGRIIFDSTNVPIYEYFVSCGMGEGCWVCEAEITYDEIIV